MLYPSCQFQNEHPGKVQGGPPVTRIGCMVTGSNSAPTSTISCVAEARVCDTICGLTVYVKIRVWRRLNHRTRVTVVDRSDSTREKYVGAGVRIKPSVITEAYI